MKENANRPDRRWCAILLVLATATLLSGCATPAHAPTRSSKPAAPSATATPTSVSTATATATPSATATPVAGSTPVNIPCNTVLTPNQVYAYNPNYVDDSAYAPTPSSPEATVKASQGTSCGWVNETSSETFGVAIGKPAAPALASAKTGAAAGGTPVAGYSGSSGVAAYFSTAGGVGRVQAFQGKYWVVVSSTTFGQAQDATPVLQAVLKNLPAS